MGQSKAKRAFDSIIFGVLNKLVVTVCPFVVRTVMIYTIGEQ